MVEVPDSNDFFNFQPQGLTVTAWILGPSERYSYPVYKHGNYAFAQWPEEEILSLIEGGNGLWQMMVPLGEGSEGEWRFVAITYDPIAEEQTAYGIYDDDDILDVLHSEAVATAITPYDDVENPLYIGGSVFHAAADGIYDGAVDDVRIYNYALTPSQLQGIYASMTGNPLCMDLAEPTLAPYDYDNDCQVTLADFVAFAGAWLNTEIVIP